MSSFVDIIGSVLTGGATGLLGTVVSGGLEFFKQKQKDEHELALMAEQRQNLELEVQGKERVAQIESESARDVAESNAFAKSFETAASRWSEGNSPWLVGVDVARGLTRPLLTGYLCALVTVLWFTTEDPAIRQRIVATVLYLATAAVLWWFGTRFRRPPRG